MNKFYIQIVLFLLSIFLHVNNKTLANEPTPRDDTKSKSKKHYPTSERVYEEKKHLLCTNPEETKKAAKLMNEVITKFKHHAITTCGYELYKDNHKHNICMYKKKLEDHTNVEKINYSVGGPDKYINEINKLWSSDNAKIFNARSVKRKIARVYNPNLVLIQQRYKSGFWGRWKYFYALATKVDVSGYETIIVMTSVNVNDHNPSNKEYKNTIIENANLFTIDIDSEDDIKNGKLQKTFVNIAGYLINKKCDGFARITFVASIHGHSCI
ncbi:fam-a protein [Plasmodium vinckei brucechwatti]|uniref:Fam-a protein n=1 Tax=Plasmodium vinckei brucechwatti TaxID=119398 RepID=A0A6V7RV31_PLAVN|nr:fam-a protein [Plasmodium vinckei brucechwatti]